MNKYLSKMQFPAGFILVVFGLLLANYFAILDNAFLGDDSIRITGNEELNSLWQAITGKLGDRPLLMLSIWFDKLVFGLNPVCFRIMNIMFHSFVTYQFFTLMLEMTKSEFKEARNYLLLVALLFALHPLHNQIINITIQRGVLIAGFFALLSMRYFFKYQSSNNKWSLFISVICFSAGLLAKPVVVFLPFLFLVYSRHKSIIFYMTGLLPVIFFYMVMDKNIQQNAIGPFQYFLVQQEVLLQYLKFIIFPWGMSYLYDFRPPGIVNWFLLFLYLALIIAGFKLIKDKILKWIFIGFVISFLPESSVFPIEHLAFDHRTYFPMLFIFLFVGYWGVKREIWKKTASFPVMLLILVAYLGINQIRNQQITPTHNWLVHTLEHSISHDISNFTGAIYLLKNGKVKELDPVIKRYREKFSERPEYKLLIESHDFLLQPKNIEIIYRITEYLHVTELNGLIRHWGNYLILNHVDENLTLKEKTLARQMLVFHKKENKEYFKEFIEYYPKLAGHLINANVLDEIELLRIKSILTFYYNQSFDGLSKEIKAALLKDPDSIVLQRLDEMVK